MTCFNTGWGFLVDYQFWNERVGIITAIVATVALGFAWYQVVIGRRG
ncbi:hypothetical protein HQQ94_12375 [Shewanella sp. VB17]|nr:hypothetical protein [Shewanella sp. VB17]NRD74018.1 hypothetical protein [Shewanella sp. VB17]